jgi:hypothetical protein
MSAAKQTTAIYNFSLKLEGVFVEFITNLCITSIMY